MSPSELEAFAADVLEKALGPLAKVEGTPYVKLRKELQGVQSAYREYCRSFDRRVAKRQSDRQAKQARLAERTALGEALPKVQDQAETLYSYVDTVDGLFHMWADSFVVVAAKAADADIDGLRALGAYLEGVVIAVSGLIPGATVPATIASVIKETKDLNEKLDKAKTIAKQDALDVKRDAALRIVQMARRVIEAFAGLIVPE